MGNNTKKQANKNSNKKKKIIIWSTIGGILVAAAAIIPPLLLTRKQPVAPVAPTVDGIVVKTEAQHTEFNIGDSFDRTGLTIEASYTDGSKQVLDTGFNTNFDGHKFEEIDCGQQMVTVEYDGKTCQYAINVNKVLKGVNVNTQSKHFVKFNTGETFTSSGLKLDAYFVACQETETVSSGFTTNLDNHKFTSDEQGLKTVEVTYKEKKCSYDILVNETITSIQVDESSTHTKEYKVGQKFSNEGLKIKVNLSGGTSKVIDAGYTLDLENRFLEISDVGEKTVTVTYAGHTCDFKITISRDLKSISVHTDSAHKKSFTVGEQFTAANLKLDLAYEDGQAHGVATSGYTTSPDSTYKFADADATAGKKDITVTYAEKTCTYSVSVERAVKQISIDTSSTHKTTFEVGDYYDSTGLAIKVEYETGDPIVITKGFTVDLEDHQFIIDDVGTKKVNISYKNQTCSYDVTVNNTITKIKVSNESGHKTSFTVGESFNTNNLKITVYTSKQQTDVTEGFTVEGVEVGHTFTETEISDAKPITIKIGDKSCSYNIKVTPKLYEFANAPWSFVAAACEDLEATWDGTAYSEAGIAAFCAKFTINGAAPTSLDDFIGASKTIKINSVDHTVKVIGHSHDDIAEGTYADKKAALTFELFDLLCDSDGNALKTCYKTPDESWISYESSSLRKNLNGGGTSTVGLWTKSALEMITENNNDWAGKIKTAKKTALYKAQTGPSELRNYNEKLFCLSVAEYNYPFSARRDTEMKSAYIKHEGTPYKYWEDHTELADRIKKDIANKTASRYWTNSKFIKDGGYYNYAYFVYDTGKMAQYYLDDLGKETNFYENRCPTLTAIAPAFCL